MKLGKQFNGIGFNAPVGANRVVPALVIALAPAVCAAEDIAVPSAILSVIEKVDVPAPEAGVLQSLAVRDGAKVDANQRVAQIDTQEQQLMAELVKQDLVLARREAESDIRIRLAEKEHQVAQVELQRSTSVNADFPNTVSAKEIDRLKLAVDTTKLEIEHAKFERILLDLRIRRIEADLQLAQHKIDRLAIVSPIPGIVAQVDKSAGEWVDKGELVLRVVRVDRLKVEGYVAVTDAVKGLLGRPVEVESVVAGGAPVRAVGKVVFVSPEAEPVDAQVRFWAEVDNSALQLRPGLTASVTIRDAPPKAARVSSNPRPNTPRIP